MTISRNTDISSGKKEDGVWWAFSRKKSFEESVERKGSAANAKKVKPPTRMGEKKKEEELSGKWGARGGENSRGAFVNNTRGGGDCR